MFTPHLSPFNGGFQLEWNYGDDYLEIEFREEKIGLLMILDKEECCYTEAGIEHIIPLMSMFFDSLREKGFKDDKYP